MLRRLGFRDRIVLLVALAALGLMTVTAVTLGLGRRGEHQLTGIETRYVPLIELDRDLKTLYTQTTQALEDAATAAEEARLADADRLVGELRARIGSGAAQIRENGGDPDALVTTLDAYYVLARGVSAALVGGASPAQLGAKIEDMRRAHETLTARLDAATTPDRSRLTAAFATTRASQRAALTVDIAVAIGVLLLMALLSWRIIRGTTRSLQAVSRGVERLARGEFGTEIEVTSTDEFGDLAREGNQTAGRLREYRDRTEALLRELQVAHDTLEARNATLVSAQQLLEERAGELARASRHKSEFLANMSHELRTPLNSIMILSKVLSENDGARLTDKQVEFATLINRSGEELLALINEVLDLAKVEAGRQVLTCADVATLDVEDYARRMFSPIAAQKQIGYEVEAGPELPPTIRTDWARLAQVLKNLIANAFKFTERGTVKVRIARPTPAQHERFTELAGPDPIVISVTDTGIGISPEQQAWIFEAFAQAEGGTSRKYGGTGLGLTIAKQLAMRLGGDLALDSAIGAGSTFHVVLPIEGPPMDSQGAQGAEAARPESSLIAPAAPALAPARVEPASGPDPVLAGKTVLIVDDDMRNVYSLSSTLQARQIRVLTAGDGQEALDELAEHPEIDAVLMDVMMPGMDGHEATRRIRARRELAALPIIVVTASGVAGQRETALAAGASEFLAKPIDLDRLLALLRAALSPQLPRPGEAAGS